MTGLMPKRRRSKRGPVHYVPRCKCGKRLEQRLNAIQHIGACDACQSAAFCSARSWRAMRTVALSVLAFAVMFGGGIALAWLPDAQSIQVCGQGIVLRGDGAIVIDAWKVWDMKAVSPNTPSERLAATQSQPTLYPTKVEFALGVSDATRVCFEEVGGNTHCVDLAALRKVKAR
jgi:hypothetical protein